MSEQGHLEKRPYLTRTQLDLIATAIGADLVARYVPPARPFAVGDGATWGIHRDYIAQIPHPSVGHIPASLDMLSRRLAHALGSPLVVSVSTLWPDLSLADIVTIDSRLYSDAIVICADVLQRLADPTPLLSALRHLLQEAALVIVSVPLRPLTLISDHLGPPSNPAHAREWTLPELLVGLDAYGMEPLFGGTLILTDTGDSEVQLGVVVASCRTPTAGHMK